MKTALLLLCVALTGCATTRLSVTTPSGVKVVASFPKNLDAENLRITFNPTSGTYEFSAKTLHTDAATVIREKTVGVAAVAGAVSDVAKAVSLP